MALITDRIKQIIEIKSLTPSQLADSIKVNRSRLSHILTGRNNPSLDLVQNILNTFPDINPEWLIFGQGNTFRQQEDIGKLALGDLFSQSNSELNNPEQTQAKSQIFEPQPLPKEQINVKQVENEKINTVKESFEEISFNNDIHKYIPKKRKVKMITIFYDDNEYEILYPDNT